MKLEDHIINWDNRGKKVLLNWGWSREKLIVDINKVYTQRNNKKIKENILKIKKRKYNKIMSETRLSENCAN